MSEYCKKCYKLAEENEELKARCYEIYNNAEQLANKYYKYDGKKENELVEIIDKTTDERNKYKHALEEIKEIAKEAQNIYFDSDKYSNYQDIAKLMNKQIYKQLQIISEVENE